MKTTMRARGTYALLVMAAAVCSSSGVAHAQPGKAAGASSTSTATPANHAAAQVHFKKAKELYQSGAYHEAAAELEAALALDPNAKELVFNLGVVDERLGRIDDALTEFHKYQALDLTPAERTRSESYVRRLEGAKKALAAAAPPPPPPAPVVVPPPVTSPPPVDTAPPSSPSHGRIDAATGTTFILGAVGVVGGAAFGVIALATRPHNYMTGTDGQTYQSYQDASDSYHRDATVSTVALAVGGAALAVSAILFFARTSDDSPPPAAAVLAPLVSGIRF